MWYWALHGFGRVSSWGEKLNSVKGSKVTVFGSSMSRSAVRRERESERIHVAASIAGGGGDVALKVVGSLGKGYRQHNESNLFAFHEGNLTTKNGETVKVCGEIDAGADVVVVFSRDADNAHTLVEGKGNASVETYVEFIWSDVGTR